MLPRSANATISASTTPAGPRWLVTSALLWSVPTAGCSPPAWPSRRRPWLLGWVCSPDRVSAGKDNRGQPGASTAPSARSSSYRIDPLAADMRPLHPGYHVQRITGPDAQVRVLAALERPEPVRHAEDAGRRKGQRPQRLLAVQASLTANVA